MLQSLNLYFRIPELGTTDSVACKTVVQVIGELLEV